ncbi:MAG: SAM-dependent methyltransferase [Planctomycetota bacterium]|jgi:SAM-dependent methyltransferase
MLLPKTRQILACVLLAAPAAAQVPAPTGTSAPSTPPQAAPSQAAPSQAAPSQAKEAEPVYMGRRIAQTMSARGASWLIRNSRENEENGVLLRKWLDVQPGDAIADFGCGNGYHTLPLAIEVGAKGKVFAVDLQPEMLELLAERAEAEAARLGTTLNVEPILATTDAPNLPPKSCDFVLMVDVYHELSNPARVLGALEGALTEDGVIVLVEYRAEDRSVPIKPLHKMSKAQVIAEMAANGFTLAAETDELPWQHAMAFARDKTDAPIADFESAIRPHLGTTAMAAGFLDAMSNDDPRIVAPFLDETVGIDGGLPWQGKKAAIEIGRWMKASETPLIPAGTTCALTMKATGEADGVLTPPEGLAIFESRVHVHLHRNENGLWLIDQWSAVQ